MPEPLATTRPSPVTLRRRPGQARLRQPHQLRGNTKTEDEVLRREMRQMEGGWASTYLIDRSKARLKAPRLLQGSQRRDPGGSRHRRPGRRQPQRRRATVRL
ncbi:POTRA domain-containing protein [Pseudomonas aeruginosa]